MLFAQLSVCKRVYSIGIKTRFLSGRELPDAQMLNLIVTTNLMFADWVQVFDDERLKAALLDRLIHDHVLKADEIIGNIRCLENKLIGLNGVLNELWMQAET